jgi:hypothetical protein
MVHVAENALSMTVSAVPHPGVETNVAARSIFDPRPSWRVAG